MGLALGYAGTLAFKYFVLSLSPPHPLIRENVYHKYKQSCRISTRVAILNGRL